MGSEIDTIHLQFINTCEKRTWFVTKNHLIQIADPLDLTDGGFEPWAESRGWNRGTGAASWYESQEGNGSSALIVSLGSSCQYYFLK